MAKKLLTIIVAFIIIFILSSNANGIFVPIIIFGIIGLFFYFIPSYIAQKRQHAQKTPILILNIFLGWTFIGWVIALIWATLNDKKS